MSELRDDKNKHSHVFMYVVYMKYFCFYRII